MTFNLVLGFGGNTISVIEKTKTVYEMLKILNNLGYRIANIKLFINSDCIIEFFDLLLHLDESLEEYMKEIQNSDIYVGISNNTERFSTCIHKLYTMCETSDKLVSEINDKISIIFDNLKYDIVESRDRTDEINKNDNSNYLNLKSIKIDISKLISFLNYVNTQKLVHNYYNTPYVYMDPREYNDPHNDPHFYTHPYENLDIFSIMIYNLRDGLEILIKIINFYNIVYLFIPEDHELWYNEELALIYLNNGGKF